MKKPVGGPTLARGGKPITPGLVVIGVLTAGLALSIVVAQKRKFAPSVRLPAGQTLAQLLSQKSRVNPAGWHTNIYCQRGLPVASFGFKENARLAAFQLYARFQEWRGQTLLRAPQSPLVDCVTPRLGECYQNSREVYLLAAELDTERMVSNVIINLCFAWGGTNQLHHAREWNALIEQGICNGVFEITHNLSGRQPQPKWGLQTNQCAVVRDQPGVVKIVPIQLLGTYVDKGFIKLPK